MIHRRQLNGLKGTALSSYGPIPENQVTSLDVLRKYIGPQPQPTPAPSEMEAPDYWVKRGQQEALVIARGTFLRFTANLSALNIPADSPAGKTRDELLAVLEAHGYGAAKAG